MDPSTRCGADWADANANCYLLCQTNADCPPSYPSCYRALAVVLNCPAISSSTSASVSQSPAQETSFTVASTALVTTTLNSSPVVSISINSLLVPIVSSTVNAFVASSVSSMSSTIGSTSTTLSSTSAAPSSTSQTTSTGLKKSQTSPTLSSTTNIVPSNPNVAQTIANVTSITSTLVAADAITPNSQGSPQISVDTGAIVGSVVALAAVGVAGTFLWMHRREQQKRQNARFNRMAAGGIDISRLDDIVQEAVAADHAGVDRPITSGSKDPNSIMQDV